MVPDSGVRMMVPRNWIPALLAFGSVVGPAPALVHAQAPTQTELQLRVGWWMPTGALSLPEHFDAPPPIGEVALGQTILVGAVVVHPLSARFSLRFGADVGMPRPVPRLEGELCNRERTRGRVDESCHWDGAPRMWLVQGRAEVLVEFGGPVSLGAGLAPRALSSRGLACPRTDPTCLAAAHIGRQPGFTTGVLGSALVRPTIFGQRMSLQLTDIVSRVEGRFQHEIHLALGLPVGWAHRVDSSR